MLPAEVLSQVMHSAQCCSCSSEYCQGQHLPQSWGLADVRSSCRAAHGLWTKQRPAVVASELALPEEHAGIIMLKISAKSHDGQACRLVHNVLQPGQLQICSVFVCSLQ